MHSYKLFIILITADNVTIFNEADDDNVMQLTAGIISYLRHIEMRYKIEIM